ncbi:MAG: hypothetical protein FWF96_03640 [Kiritimatiellaeota bacterium]|nr:hypothetical protein [Kiritimatiellota bacterium]
MKDTLLLRRLRTTALQREAWRENKKIVRIWDFVEALEGETLSSRVRFFDVITPATARQSLALQRRDTL